jgi:carbonic anhydrase
MSSSSDTRCAAACTPATTCAPAAHPNSRHSRASSAAGWTSCAARVDGEAAQKAALEREAVLVSLENLRTFPFVTEAQRSGILTLHGTWFDIGTGELHVWSREEGFAPV